MKTPTPRGERAVLNIISRNGIRVRRLTVRAATLALALLACTFVLTFVALAIGHRDAALSWMLATIAAAELARVAPRIDGWRSVRARRAPSSERSR